MFRSKPNKACDEMQRSAEFSTAGRGTTNLVDANRFLPVETSFFSPEITRLLLTPHFKDNIPCFPLSALVTFAFKHNLVSFWHTRQDVKSILRSVVQDFGTTAMVAHLNDDFTLATALVTTTNNAKAVQYKLHIT
jgi:hypothetical protein